MIGDRPALSANQKPGLVRVVFGLHKMILAAKRFGKFFGIDNLTRKSHWIRYFPDIVDFNENSGIKLITHRTTKFHPLSGLCSVVGKSRKTKFGVLFVISLNYPIQQMTLLPQLDANLLRPMLFLENNNLVRGLLGQGSLYLHGRQEHRDHFRFCDLL